MIERSENSLDSSRNRDLRPARASSDLMYLDALYAERESRIRRRPSHPHHRTPCLFGSLDTRCTTSPGSPRRSRISGINGALPNTLRETNFPSRALTEDYAWTRSNRGRALSVVRFRRLPPGRSPRSRPRSRPPRGYRHFPTHFQSYQETGDRQKLQTPKPGRAIAISSHCVFSSFSFELAYRAHAAAPATRRRSGPTRKRQEPGPPRSQICRSCARSRIKPLVCLRT